MHKPDQLDFAPRHDRRNVTDHWAQQCRPHIAEIAASQLRTMLGVK